MSELFDPEPEEEELPEIEEGKTLICVRGLKNGFGDQIVHEGLDLDVKKGEILGVVGGSGTGKSVLMRSIIGLQKPLEGDITVFGESMIDRSEDEATAIRKRKNCPRSTRARRSSACAGSRMASAARSSMRGWIWM